MHTRQANMLAEIDSLDIHVIVNDELDLSPQVLMPLSKLRVGLWAFLSRL